MCSAFLFATVICLICQKKKECFSKPENLFLLLSLVLCPLYLFKNEPASAHLYAQAAQEYSGSGESGSLWVVYIYAFYYAETL